MSPTECESSAQDKVSLYAAWCKRCGICVAFCPAGALKEDEWGHPHFAHPEKCTACHLCEKLCPDFAVTVEGKSPKAKTNPASPNGGTRKLGVEANPRQSPERVAPEPNEQEDRTDD
jgi:2-oxoglutarate ferredoxin oxidoreductase subunit delta